MEDETTSTLTPTTIEIDGETYNIKDIRNAIRDLAGNLYNVGTKKKDRLSNEEINAIYRDAQQLLDDLISGDSRIENGRYYLYGNLGYSNNTAAKRALEDNTLYNIEDKKFMGNGLFVLNSAIRHTTPIKKEEPAKKKNEEEFYNDLIKKFLNESGANWGKLFIDLDKPDETTGKRGLTNRYARVSSALLALENFNFDDYDLTEQLQQKYKDALLAAIQAYSSPADDDWIAFYHLFPNMNEEYYLLIFSTEGTVPATLERIESSAGEGQKGDAGEGQETDPVEDWWNNLHNNNPNGQKYKLNLPTESVAENNTWYPKIQQLSGKECLDYILGYIGSGQKNIEKWKNLNVSEKEENLALYSLFIKAMNDNALIKLDNNEYVVPNLMSIQNQVLTYNSKDNTIQWRNINSLLTVKDKIINAYKKNSSDKNWNIFDKFFTVIQANS